MLIIKCTGKNIETILKNYRQKVDKTRRQLKNGNTDKTYQSKKRGGK